jgi:hypothetical protein
MQHNLPHQLSANETGEQPAPPRAGDPACAARLAISGEDPGGQTSISPPVKVKSLDISGPVPLASGIDTLYLAIDVKWSSPDFFHYLHSIKAKAEETETAIPGLLADWPFLIQPYGRRGYQWLLEGQEFSWRIGNWFEPQSRPSVMVEIRSETLWHLGPRKAVDRVLSLLAYVSNSNLAEPTIKAVKVSRVDLCLDLLLPVSSWSLDLLPLIVCRAQNIRPHLKGDTLTGIGIGAGQLSARLYDKALEILVKSAKGWMFDIWGLKEVPEGQKVIRVEFQLLREVLKELAINGPDDLFRLESNAWAYCSQQWLKFQDRPGLHHTQRNNLPWWDVVQNGYRGTQAAHPLVRCKAIRDNQTQLIRQAYGLLTSLTALQMERTGEDIAIVADFNDCLSTLFETVGLLGENHDFGELVFRKRTRYHRSRTKMLQAIDLRKEFGFFDDTNRADAPKGGYDAN